MFDSEMTELDKERRRWKALYRNTSLPSTIIDFLVDRKWDGRRDWVYADDEWQRIIGWNKRGLQERYESKAHKQDQVGWGLSLIYEGQIEKGIEKLIPFQDDEIISWIVKNAEALHKALHEVYDSK